MNESSASHNSSRDVSINTESRRIVITSTQSRILLPLSLIQSISFSDRIKGGRYRYWFQANSCRILCQCTCSERGISNVHQSSIVRWTNNGVRVDRSGLVVSVVFCFGFLDLTVDRLPRPLDSSCTVQFRICATFESGSAFGNGILLRKFNVRLGTLMKYSNRSFRASLKV